MKNTIELIYGARIKRDGKFYFVSFRDIKNAFTQGATYQEAVFNAQEVLDLMILDALEKNEEIPVPSKFRKFEVPISASPEVAAPALLHIIRMKSQRSMADVARTMKVPYQTYQRIESGKNLTMRSLKKAASALGSIVEIRLRKASI